MGSKRGSLSAPAPEFLPSHKDSGPCISECMHYSHDLTPQSLPASATSLLCWGPAGILPHRLLPDSPSHRLNLQCHPHFSQAHWSLGWRRLQTPSNRSERPVLRHGVPVPGAGGGWVAKMEGVGGGAEQKGFPNNFPLQRGKTYHKSCLEWVLCVALCLKIFFFREATFWVIFCWGGDKKERSQGQR